MCGEQGTHPANASFSRWLLDQCYKQSELEQRTKMVSASECQTECLRQISRRICWKRQDLCFDWNFRGHLGQLCGFIDEHAEALEVCDHLGIWPFGGGVEAHPSPSQLQDRIPLVLWNLGSCSPSATGSSEEWRYEGAPLRAPQMKSPKMPYSGLTCTLTQWHSHWLCDTRWHLVLSAKFTWVVLGSYDSSVCTVSKEYSSCEGLS